MQKWYVQIILFFCASFSVFAQNQFNTFLKPNDSLNTKRRNAVVFTEASLAGLTLLGLDQLWYKDFPRSKFHTLNDNNEWLQMDKMGHVFTSYQVGKYGADVLNWAGVSKRDQLIYGATLGFSFLTAVEVFDGYSKEWGFSWGDMLANAAGTGLYVGQELLWKEQRINIKYSFHQTKYAAMRPEKLGSGFLEEMLKDYNGQTYWLSVNFHSFFKKTSVPRWLNVAFGYGADGLLSGENDQEIDISASYRRNRQFFLSLDVDFSRIPTKSRALKTFFNIINIVKVPFPTLEFGKKGAAFHLFYH